MVSEDVKNNFIWTPVLGILFLLLFTKFGVNRYYYISGTIWYPFQFICVVFLLYLLR